MPISAEIKSAMTRASWIRRMFEEGVRMKREFGDENVFDFSLGNPILEPPESVQETLRRLANDPPAGLHRYMPNGGHPEVRARISEHLRSESGEPIEGDDVIMTNGAAGALNVTLKALLDPGDQVVVITPFFPEYMAYAHNHGAELVKAESAADFDLDIQAIARAVSERTKVVLINSPNNPTGRTYSAERLAELGALLTDKQREHGRSITLLSDEPYRKITFDGRSVPWVFSAHPNVIVVMSHSKDLGLAGERIGYAAISPSHADRSDLREAMTFTNRTLGFVNASAMFQWVAAENQSSSVPVETYQELRDLFCRGLSDAGFDLVRPQGAFYIFPKTPIPDDVEFVRILLQNKVLAVPGSGFGRAGHMRLSFCVTRREVEGALPIFRRVAKEVGDS